MPDARLTPAGTVTNFLRTMLPYLQQARGLIALGSVASIVSNTAVVLPAILLGRALDAVLGWQAGRVAAPAAGAAIAAWAGGVALVELPRIVRRYLLGCAHNRVRTQLRADAMRGVLGWPLARLHGIATGDLMARIVGDVDVVGTGVRTLTTDTWDTLYHALVTLIALVAYNPGLTGMALAPVPAAMLLAHATRRWVGGRTAAARVANADLTAALQEQLAGTRLLRLLGRSSGAVERIRHLADLQARANVAVVRLREGLVPAYSMLMAAGVVLVVWRGGLNVTAGAMTVGSFVAYLELYLQFASRGHRVPRYLNRLQSAGAAWERLMPLVETPPAAARPRFASFRPGRIEGGTGVSASAGAEFGPVEVSVRALSFRYPGAARRSLDGVSLEIPAGSFIAITGPVGSGKSALARALLGLYPLEEGDVRWDGIALETIPAARRAVRCGYLPQDSGLFSGTIRENILMTWPPAGAPDVAPQAALAALHDDLAGFPHGLDTQIGETGIRISGGQRQRVALARALAAALPGAPGLLVLDDPFAAVDAETEARIVRTLLAHHGPAAPPDRRVTLVLFSHRLAAFPSADRVVVLGDGGIREAGPHAELMRAGGLYARIFAAQSRATGRAR